MDRFRSFRLWAFLALLFAVLAVPSLLRAGDSASDLKFVLIFARHGIRPPLTRDRFIVKMAAQPWPQWEVPAEFLTPHGAQALSLLGGYYRVLYRQEGLLTGDPSADSSHIFLYADNDQRTIASARNLALGLIPGVQAEVASRPPGEIDGLFRPTLAHVGDADSPLAIEAVLGRIGHDPAGLLRAHRPAYDLLERVLFGGDGRPPEGKLTPAEVGGVRVTGREPGKDRNNDAIVNLEPFHKCMTTVEDLLLEYEDGMPLADVGWGRVTPEVLTQLLDLHQVFWDLDFRTPYVAQVQASNLAAHIMATLDQAVTAQPEQGAFGRPSDRLVVVDGHDSNQIALSGLMGISWRIPGSQMNPVLPGGALVFEVRQRRDNGQFEVRVQYVAQTLEQLRNLTPLSLQSPPYTAPIFIPGCSGSDAASDAPYAAFKAFMERAIDPRFVRL